MDILSLLLQVATVALLVYLLIQFKALFREVRTPVVRQKGQLPADFRDRLRNMPRPGNDGAKERSEGDRGDRNRDGRDNRGENRGDRNRDGRDNRGENRGDRNRDGRDNRGENRGDRNRDGRDNRGENRGDRNRDGRDNRGENRGDRGPRPPRPEVAAAPVAEASAPVASSDAAPAPAAAPAPSFGGRRPLGPSASSESSAAEVSTPDALAPASLAQPVNSDSPIRHGRRALPKAKPRFDDEPESTTEASA